MGARRRSQIELPGDREAGVLAGTLGREVRSTRRRRRLTQEQLGASVGLSHARIREIERGDGHSTPLGTWIRLGFALGRPLAVGFSRDIRDSAPADAGHLAAQECLLGLARRCGRATFFELPTRPRSPALSVDVGIRIDLARALVIIEIWNRLDDLGVAARTTDRKVSEAEALATPIGGDELPFRVAACWALVDTVANRELAKRYPAVFRSRFPGRSSGWVAALATCEPIPKESGLVWIDPRRGRLSEVRLAGINPAGGSVKSRRVRA
jgi:transcriptional regulator with XRE-family HTH domain